MKFLECEVKGPFNQASEKKTRGEEKKEKVFFEHVPEFNIFFDVWIFLNVIYFFWRDWLSITRIQYVYTHVHVCTCVNLYPEVICIMPPKPSNFNLPNLLRGGEKKILMTI